MRVQPDQTSILIGFLETQVGECGIDARSAKADEQRDDRSMSSTLKSLREVWLTIPPLQEQTEIVAFAANGERKDRGSG